MFPRVIDNTMRVDFRRCPRLFRNRHVLCLRPKGTRESIDLISGAAFARGLEVTRKKYWQEKLPFEHSLAQGIRALWDTYPDIPIPDHKRGKSPERLVHALQGYFEVWPFGADRIKMAFINGEPAVEFSFALDLPIRHPDTKEPIIYAGRYDWTGVYADTLLVACDEKTTGSMGAGWADKWRLWSQFMGYGYAGRKFGIQLYGACIRGVALLIDSAKYQEVLIQFHDHMLKRWYEQLLADTQNMVRAYEFNAWEYDLADGCNAYSGCTYDILCQAKNEAPWIENSFQRVSRWSPLIREEG